MIPVYQPLFIGREKEYVNQCLDSTWISSKGEFIDRFESQFGRYTGAEYATTVSNGTTALHLAIEVLGLGSDDEVIVPSLTYIASVNTIMQAGAKPVFVDSVLGSWNIDPTEVERKITAKTKAVMVVHLYGSPCDMDALTRICREHNLFLIEDCAEAFGSRYGQRHVGTFGDVSTFSFFGNKTITTGEGGMVVTKTAELIQRAKHLKSQGVSAEREYWHDVVAYNYRMTNICAAIGLAQLEQADTIIRLKRQVAGWYAHGLKDLPVQMQQEMPGTLHSYWMCSILVDSANTRNELRKHMRAHDVDSRPVFYPAHTMPHTFRAESFPVAESLASRGINLPSYPALTQEQVTSICGVIRNYFESRQ